MLLPEMMLTLFLFGGLILLVGLVVCAIILLTDLVVRSLVGRREHQNERR